MGIFASDTVDKIIEAKFGGLKEQLQKDGMWDSFYEGVKGDIKKQVAELEESITVLQSQCTSIVSSIASTTAAAAIPTSAVAAVGSAFQIMSMVKDLSLKLQDVMEKVSFLGIEPPSVLESIVSMIDSINSALDAFPFP